MGVRERLGDIAAEACARRRGEETSPFIRERGRSTNPTWEVGEITAAPATASLRGVELTAAVAATARLRRGRPHLLGEGPFQQLIQGY